MHTDNRPVQTAESMQLTREMQENLEILAQARGESWQEVLENALSELRSLTLGIHEADG